MPSGCLYFKPEDRLSIATSKQGKSSTASAATTEISTSHSEVIEIHDSLPPYEEGLWNIQAFIKESNLSLQFVGFLETLQFQPGERIKMIRENMWTEAGFTVLS